LIKSLNIVLTDMIAAGGVHCLPARTPWPMHCALRLLYEDAGRTGGHDRNTEAFARFTIASAAQLALASWIPLFRRSPGAPS
jgi:hypothetical protein